MQWAREGNPQVICRLGGTDREGLFYIGRTNNLRRRIRLFWKGVNGEESTVPRSDANTYIDFDYKA